MRKYFQGTSLKPIEKLEMYFHSYWMYSILVDNPQMREDLRKHLSANGIETRPSFYPVHTMPMFAQKFQKLPVAEYLGWCGINLPSWPGLSKKQVGQIGKITERTQIIKYFI